MPQTLQWNIKFFEKTWPEATLRDLLELGIPLKVLRDGTRFKRGRRRLKLDSLISDYKRGL
jgi:hypothetical protein